MPEADLVVLTDACLIGFGFWCPPLNFGYHAPTLPAHNQASIFFHEAFAVACAIHWACCLPDKHPRHLLVSSDSSNTIDTFNTLRAHGLYNEILKFAVDLLMQFDIDLRVLHITGEANSVADCLLRGLLTQAQTLWPALSVFPYQPPKALVEAVSP